MEPIGIPEQAALGRPELKAHHIGPPPGVSDEECGTVEALVGYIDGGGYPSYCDYWRPTPDELEYLNNGGFIELIQYTPTMIMHAMNIWQPVCAADCNEAATTHILRDGEIVPACLRHFNHWTTPKEEDNG